MSGHGTSVVGRSSIGKREKTAGTLRIVGFFLPGGHGSSVEEQKSVFYIPSIFAVHLKAKRWGDYWYKYPFLHLMDV